MGKILNKLLNCKGGKCTPLNLFKDFYFLFMLIFPVTGLFILFSGFNEVFVGLYLYLVYFGILALYWTPVFQEGLDINSNALNFLMYLFQWMPFLGNIGLLVLKLSQRDQREPKGNIRKIELKRNAKRQIKESNKNDEAPRNDLLEKKQETKEEEKAISGSKPVQHLKEIKNFHKRYGRDARILEKIGRRLVITDDYEPEKVYNMLDQVYQLRRDEQDKLSREKYRDRREGLREIAEESKENGLDSVIESLEGLLGEEIDIHERSQANKKRNIQTRDAQQDEENEKNDSKIDKDQESKSNEEFLNKINNFHKRGGYRYQVLERIGRRLHKQGEAPEKVYSTILEFSKSDRFEEMGIEELEEIAIEARESSVSDIKEKLV